MSLEQNKDVVRRLYDQCFNGRRLEVADEVVALNFVNHASAEPGKIPGPEDIRRLVQSLNAAFPDHHMTIDDLIAEGDRVVMRSTWTGTHQGEFPPGFPATGKRVTQAQMHIYRVIEGKCVEHWGLRDDVGMFKQIGATVSPKEKPV